MTIIRSILFSLITLLCLSGCGAVQLVISFAPEVQRLHEGEREFEQGNYEQAEAIFQEVYTSDVSAQTKNTALYNLACTRIITASDSAQFLAAISLLDKWEKTYPSIIYVENPNLIIAALKERTSVIKEDRDLALQQVQKNKSTITKQKEIIAELNEQLQTLQHQIHELEAIDHQLQEKKKPL